MRTLFAAIVAAVACPAGLVAASAQRPADGRPPNIVIIFCDDLGYGDLGAFGHPTIRTPNLDRLAREGQKWTSFYVAASVCTPSRAALLTGRLPIRSGMCSGRRRVLFPDSAGGLPQSEWTIAEALKSAGYATGCVGKWHLGHLPQHLPTQHGFDTYWGIPYSNDMDRQGGPDYRRMAAADPNYLAKSEYWRVPIIHDGVEVERPADQLTLTRRYTERAVRFITDHRDRPFFLYLAHSMPHIPLFASDERRGRSRRGLYGDVIEEIDGSVGRIVETLERFGLAGNTLLVFTSDNGPWLPFRTHGGSAGPLRDGKGTTWEGGMREPTIFWWPGRLERGVVMEMGSTLDLLPTACALAGVEVPEDRLLDGYDLSPVLFGAGPGPRDEMFFYRGTELYAVRKGPWKAHFITQGVYGYGPEMTRHDPPLLYHLGYDPAERFNVAEDHPDVIEELRRLAERHTVSIEPVESQLEKRINE